MRRLARVSTATLVAFAAIDQRGRFRGYRVRDTAPMASTFKVMLLAGWKLFLKAGWGSGTGPVDHQVALLRRGRKRVALAIFTELDPDHTYGKQTLRGVAARLLRGL